MIKGGRIAAEQIDTAATGVVFEPTNDDDADAVHAGVVLADLVEAEVRAEVDQGGIHHGEAFDAPVEAGDLFDEAEFAFGGGAELVDEGGADFIVFLEEYDEV